MGYRALRYPFSLEYLVVVNLDVLNERQRKLLLRKWSQRLHLNGIKITPPPLPQQTITHKQILFWQVSGWQNGITFSELHDFNSSFAFSPMPLSGNRSSSDLRSSSERSSGDFSKFSGSSLFFIVLLSTVLSTIKLATSASKDSSSDWSLIELCRSNSTRLPIAFLSPSMDFGNCWFSSSLSSVPAVHSESAGLLPCDSCPLLDPASTVGQNDDAHFLTTFITLLSSSWFFVAIGRHFNVSSN